MRRPPVLCVLALMAMVASGCSRSPLDTLPPVEQPEALVGEARALAASHPSCFVEEKEWPPTVRALRPVTVEVANAALLVTIETRTGVGAWGYVVAPGEAPTRAGMTLHATAASGVWKFDWHP